MEHSQFHNDLEVNGSCSQYVYKGLKEMHKLEVFKSRAMVLRRLVSSLYFWRNQFHECSACFYCKSKSNNIWTAHLNGDFPKFYHLLSHILFVCLILNMYDIPPLYYCKNSSILVKHVTGTQPLDNDESQNRALSRRGQVQIQFSVQKVLRSHTALWQGSNWFEFSFGFGSGGHVV